MRKNERHTRIRQIVTANKVRTQEELLSYLKAAGADVTQATVSRDIRELQLIKAQEEKGTYYAFFQQASLTPYEKRLQAAIQREVLRIQAVRFIVVVVTEKRGADVVTSWLDEIDYPEVVTTIAGVDTFLVICRTDEEAAGFAQKLETMKHTDHF